MSRYIDADALKEWLDEYLSVFKKYDKGTIKGFVDHAPSIDIVRCQDCKHRKKNGFCLEHNRYEKNDNGYCSYGERSEP